MSTNLNDLVTRANLAFQNFSGFVGFVIESNSPLILAYNFAPNVDAEDFRLNRTTLATAFHYEILNNRLTTVLEHP